MTLPFVVFSSPIGVFAEWFAAVVVDIFNIFLVSDNKTKKNESKL